MRHLVSTLAALAVTPVLVQAQPAGPLVSQFAVRATSSRACRTITSFAQTCSRSADMTYRVLPDEATGPDCGLFDAVTIERTTSDVGQPFSLTCRAAVSLALWEKHAVAGAAQQHLDSTVQRIEHFGSYSCRNVYGRPDATRSRHARAEALDVAGFVLADGRRIRVLGDWNDDSRRGEIPPRRARRRMPVLRRRAEPRPQRRTSRPLAPRSRALSLLPLTLRQLACYFACATALGRSV